MVHESKEILIKLITAARASRDVSEYGLCAGTVVREGPSSNTNVDFEIGFQKLQRDSIFERACWCLSIHGGDFLAPRIDIRKSIFHVCEHNDYKFASV